MKMTDAVNLVKDQFSLDIDTADNKRTYLERLMNKPMKIVISDGRILIGQFLCTDREKNVIMGSCQEFIGNEHDSVEEPRLLGLAMIPGRHIDSMYADIQSPYNSFIDEKMLYNESTDAAPMYEYISPLVGEADVTVSVSSDVTHPVSSDTINSNVVNAEANPTTNASLMADESEEIRHDRDEAVIT